MERLRQVVGAAGPAWFTSVMGTGILGVDIVASPVAIPGGSIVGAVIWTIAAIELAVILPLLIARAVTAPGGLAATFRDPVAAQLWGAPPMAAFTIAVGLMRIAAPHGGGEVAIALAQVLWWAGVAASMLLAFLIPFLMMTQHQIEPHRAVGSWLLPVVPPIVASVPAALLLPTFPEAFRPTILGIAYALLGLGIALAALMISVFFARLLFAKLPAGTLAPSMWLVVGPLGQSIAGAYALGSAAVTVWPSVGPGLRLAGVEYGVLVWGFAVYWLVLAIVATVRAWRVEMSFNLGWWAFTFPVGVLIAGSDALYTATGAALFAVGATVLLVLLAAAWALVATRTARNVIDTLAAAPRAKTAHGLAA